MKRSSKKKMKRSVQTSKTFVKEHTKREIAQYLFDPDSPPVHLNVQRWWKCFRFGWMIANVVATFASCAALVWLSYPERYEDSTNTTDWGRMSYLNWVELACVVFFASDYILRLSLTDRVLWRFLVDPANVIDILTTLPYFLQMILSSAGVKTDAFRVVFLFRTLRIIRLGKYHSGMRLVFQTLKYSYDLLLLFVVTVLLTIMLTSTAFYFAERTRWNPQEKAWMRRCPFNTPAAANCTEEITPYQSIPATMYWSIVTLTTVGFRSEAPTSTLGRVVAGVTCLAGVFFFAAPATVLATVYKRHRRSLEETKRSCKMDVRATEAMKAQEKLRKDLERRYNNRNAPGDSVTVLKRELRKATCFEYEGIVRPIYEVIQDSFYVYEPLVSLEKDPGTNTVNFTDDFSLSSAERVLAASLVLDDPQAREAARAALVSGGYISVQAKASNVLVCADPQCQIEVSHDISGAYPGLCEVVEMDEITDCQGHLQDVVGVRFVISMPHLYSTVDVLRLMRATRLLVTLNMRMLISDMHVPIAAANILASKLIRELSEIAYQRETDGSLIAYIHPSDAAVLLEGFCDHFVPTASKDISIMHGYVADQQILLTLLSSFPRVKLQWIPPQGANAIYRAGHVNTDFSEEMLVEVNITTLSRFDEMGFGERFRVTVPVCESRRKEVHLTFS